MCFVGRQLFLFLNSTLYLLWFCNQTDLGLRISSVIFQMCDTGQVTLLEICSLMVNAKSACLIKHVVKIQ